MVRSSMGEVDEYFLKLADAMEDWVACWKALNP